MRVNARVFQVLASEQDPDAAWTRAAALQQAALDAALAPSAPKKAKGKAAAAAPPAAASEAAPAENGVLSQLTTKLQAYSLLFRSGCC